MVQLEEMVFLVSLDYKVPPGHKGQAGRSASREWWGIQERMDKLDLSVILDLKANLDLTEVREVQEIKATQVFRDRQDLLELLDHRVHKEIPEQLVVSDKMVPLEIQVQLEFWEILD